MLEIYQKTLKEAVKFQGVGLHSGVSSRVKVLPGKVDSGIIFKRVDLNQNNLILANFKNVSSAKLCTTLENDHGVKVSTVEHLLAALYIEGIDNAIIEINGPEMPIMDGSSKEFLRLLKNVKIETQDKKRKYLKVLDKLELTDGRRKFLIEPCINSLQVEFQLSYNNKIIGNQTNNIDFGKDNLKDVYSSRTFCLFEDIEKIKKMGLAKGGSLENAVVVDKEKVLNKEGLRNEKEFVNHKILDLAGDLILSGHRILGKITCLQGGHELTNQFLIKLFNNKTTFDVIELDDILISKKTDTNFSIKQAVNA